MSASLYRVAANREVRGPGKEAKKTGSFEF